MNGLIAFWARNGVAANLLMIGVLIAGFFAFTKIEREVFPSGSFNNAIISVAWPGASPREVEEQIILRIEEAISDVDGVDHVEATAREGRASVTVEGKDSVDTTLFLNEIKNRIDGISTFPQDAFPPVVQQMRGEQGAIYIGLYGDFDERELNRTARRLCDELAQLPNGSPLVELWGDRAEEVSIEVSEETLRRYGLTFDDVARAIRGSSLNLAGGEVRTETGNIQVATRNLADSEDEFARIVVRQLPDGYILRVGDIAKVIDGFEERRQRREMNGKPSISLAVQAPETFNIVKLSKAVNEWVAEKNKELEPKGGELLVWFDTADLYFGRMNLVTSNAMQGLVLVLICLLLFLRPTVATWVTVGIPIAFAGAFIFMPGAGVSLNMLSLFAFLLVIGVVVDDAIVVGESIHEAVESGKKGVDAAIYGAQLVAKPVVFAVITTIFAFMPWLFMSGGTAQFTKHISLTILFALTFSLIESLFILPSHLAHMKKEKKDGRFHRFQSFFADGLLRFADRVYRPLAEKALRHRYYTVAFFLGAFALAVALLSQGWVAFKFMPEVQGTFISLTARLPEGSPYSRSLQIFEQVQEAAAKMKEELGKTRDGEDIVRSVYVRADEGQVVSYVTVIDGEKRKQSTEELSQVFRRTVGDIPDAEEINVTYTINDSGPDLSFGVEAKDLEDLRLATLDIQNYLKRLPGVFDVRNNLQSATPELQIELKSGAERFGLTLAEVTRQVRQAFYGEEVQRLPREGQDVRVMVRYPAEARSSLISVETMRIRTADGREVPLSAVADVSFSPSYKRIDRRDRKRSAMITGELHEGVDRAAIMKSFKEEFAPEWKRNHLNVSLAERGDQEEQADFMKEFISLYVIALVAMYMLIAIGFGSYWQPILIMTAIPFGFMGAAFGHFIFGLNFALFSFFGVGAAAGVVVNDNLVLIDTVNRLRAEGEGALSALVKAGVSRFRPILLTSLTTFLGLLPLMFSRATDAQFLMPTVVALAWGTFFALFVTLFFVPSLYVIGVDIARFYRWAWTGKEQAEFGEGASKESDFATPTDSTAHGQPGEPNIYRPAE